MTRILLICALVVVVAYGIFEGLPLIEGPTLSITFPANFATATSSMVLVSGRVAHATALTVDGAPVLPDENGEFSTTLALASGTSILTLSATDRFGRSITKTRTVSAP